MTNRSSALHRSFATTTRSATALFGVIAACSLGAFVAPASAQDTIDFRDDPVTMLHAPQDIGPFELLNFAPEPPRVPDLRSGAHPDLTVDLRLSERPNPAYDPGNGQYPTVPSAQLRDVEADLDAGFYGNPQNRPSCAQSRIVDSTGYCDPNAQVGVAIVQTAPDEYSDQGTIYRSVVPVYNVTTGRDETASFSFSVYGVPTLMSVTPRTDGDYGLRASIRRITQAGNVYGARVILWGDPGDPIHDRLRWDAQGNLGFDPDTGEIVGIPTTAPRLPFLSAPARCDAPLVSKIRIRSWQDPSRWVERTAEMPARTDCDALRFGASVDLQPTTAEAGKPTGAGIDLTVPQTNSIDERATPTVKDVTVKLPEGMAISPGAADGLQACSDEQLATNSRAPETCPDASKIGTATISTPLLGEKLEGSVYLGTQKSQDPTSGEMYRMFIAGYAKGVRIKLKGGIKADPRTGQLTATFAQNPQLPFDNLHLQLKDGPRAVLVNPPTCGTKTTSSTVTSYNGDSVASDSSFDVNAGCTDKPGFNPGLTAGTVNPLAGAFSPFTMSVFRQDGEQALSKIHLDLPSGLLGALGSVPVCAEAQAAAGTCDPSTRLGSTTVSVGTGDKPYSLGGTVSLGGPYKGAPFSLSIAVPAKAGPLDLGMVVVRSPLVIDANKGKVFAPADPLPTIVGGVPLRFRMVNITLDRPNFMWNATTCERQVIGARFESSAGAVSAPSVPYQAQGCDKLLLNPSLKLTYGTKKELKKGKHPSLTAELSQSFRQAGLKKVAVTLPLTSSLDSKNARALCQPAEFAARNCPETSIVGRASARTPALHEELTGPVYFLKGQRRTAEGRMADTLPKLWLKLEGEGVPLDLIADSTIVGKAPNQRLVATFDSIPDAPISSFKLQIDGGKHGILGAPRDPCTSDRVAKARFDGQNGDRRTRNVTIAAPDCGIRATVKTSSTRVQLRVVNIGAGKVKVSGKGVKARTRTIKSGKAATLTAQLTSAMRRRVAAGRTVKLRLKVSWTPKGAKKAKTATQTVTIKGAKGRAKARAAR
ncbi:hypothetical protein ACVU7I_01320 [Patulibacter sp. S7RM1-6]